VTTGIFGGIFDPPHNGHLAVLRGAERHFAFDRTLVLVATDPGHRAVHSPAESRLALARLAFSEHEVGLDEHARTVDLLRAGYPDDPVFVIGADEFVDFPRWKEPEAVLELARLGVATRPGFPLEVLETVRVTLSRPDRIELFDIEPVPVSSSDIRARVARGEPVDDLVPAAVAAEIERLGLYRN
jgi:nicotinate-nucleotide adenylyltransferase